MEELTGLDARFLYSETPTSPMHTIKIAVVDVAGRAEELTPELFEGLLAARLDRLPTLRRRLVEIPHGLGHPLWIDDPDFELRRHIRWRSAAAPGDHRALAAIVADIAAGALPRDRPLWELTVVDGLAGGEVAFVIKLHHALADGTTAVAMLQNAFVADDGSAIVTAFAPEPLPGRRDLYRVATRRRMRRLSHVPRFMRATTRGVVSARRLARQLPVVLPSPFGAPRTSLNVSLDAKRTFAMITLPVPEIIALKNAAGVTFNDVFLALCAGGLRRYLDDRGELPDVPLVSSVPLSTHTGAERLGGNHMDNMFIPLHVEVADPIERLRIIHDAATAAKQVRGALGTELFELRAEMTPPHLYSAGVRLWSRTGWADRVRAPINLVASNVPGPRLPLALDGGVVTGIYSVGPILEGIGLNITAWSYVDDLNVSVLGCPSSLPDPWALAEGLRDALGELRSAFS